jgi:hypothetical protein
MLWLTDARVIDGGSGTVQRATVEIADGRVDVAILAVAARTWLVPQNGTPVSGTAGPVGPMR